MKTKLFNVPSEIMTEFVEQMTESQLENDVIGTTEENEVAIEVHYEPEDRYAVFELTEIIEDHEDDTDSDKDED